MIDNKMNRRSFFTTVAKVVGVAAVAPAALSAVFSKEANAQTKRGAAPEAAKGGGKADVSAMPMVDPKTDATAKAVQYVEDHTKVPAAGPKKCSTCGFYNQDGKSLTTKNGKEASTCTLFAGKLVYGNGYCNSWNEKKKG